MNSVPFCHSHVSAICRAILRKLVDFAHQIALLWWVAHQSHRGEIVTAVNWRAKSSANRAFVSISRAHILFTSTFFALENYLHAAAGAQTAEAFPSPLG